MILSCKYVLEVQFGQLPPDYHRDRLLQGGWGDFFAAWRLCEKKTLKNYRSTSRYRKKLFNINCLFIDSYEIIILIRYKIYNFSHYAGGIERLNSKGLLHLSNHYPFQHPRFPVYFHRCISKEIPTNIITLYVATQFRVVA